MESGSKNPNTLSVVTFPCARIGRIAVGRSQELERQLIEKSRQPHIAQHTPKDPAQRFGTQEQFESWLGKGRNLHWLLGPENDLAGVIWYGKAAMPEEARAVYDKTEPSETFAIRLYQGYVGQGLAREAMRNSLQLATAQKLEHREPIADIWLQTDVTNRAALKTYETFGYEEIHRGDARVTMVLESGIIQKIVGIADTDLPQMS